MYSFHSKSHHFFRLFYAKFMYSRSINLRDISLQRMAILVANLKSAPTSDAVNHFDRPNWNCLENFRCPDPALPGAKNQLRGLHALISI